MEVREAFGSRLQRGFRLPAGFTGTSPGRRPAMKSAHDDAEPDAGGTMNLENRKTGKRDLRPFRISCFWVCTLLKWPPPAEV